MSLFTSPRRDFKTIKNGDTVTVRLVRNPMFTKIPAAFVPPISVGGSVIDTLHPVFHPKPGISMMRDFRTADEVREVLLKRASVVAAGITDLKVEIIP